MRYNHGMNNLLKAADSVNRKRCDALFESFCETFLPPDDMEFSVNIRRAALKHSMEIFCRLGWYEAVFRFVHPVLLKKEKYNIAELGATLDNVTVAPDYTLRALCSDFYRQVIVDKYEFSDRTNEISPEFFTADLFDPDFELPQNFNGYSRPAMESALLLLCDTVFGMSLDLETATTGDIDALAKIIESATRRKYEKQAEDARSRRREQEEEEKIYGKSLIGKAVAEEITDDLVKEALPGSLLLIFSLCEIYHRDDLCFYILSRYVLPYFDKYEWTPADKRTDPFALILTLYADYFHSLLLHYESPLYYFTFTKSEAELYGFVNAEPKAEHIKYAENALDTMKLWASVLHKSAGVLKNFLREDLFSFHIAAAAFLLSIAEDNETAADLLINHFSDSESHDSYRHLLITALIRIILKSDDLVTVNTLYGYFTSDEAVYERRRRDMQAHLREIICFFADAKEYIRENEQIEILTKKTLYDFLYTDDRVDGIAKRLTVCYNTDTLPDRKLSADLANALIGFKEQFGLNLGRFADRNDKKEVELTYDTPFQYIYGGLSEKLRLKAQNLYDRMDVFKGFRLLAATENFRRGSDLMITNKIIELRRATILKSARDLAAIRSSNLPDDIISKIIIKETEKLAAALRPDGYDRFVTEKLVRESHDSFCRRFYPDENRNLLGALPTGLANELWGYLVTSEMIFRYLDEQNDPTLDYTPALISLTKALEFVLFAAYNKLSITDTADVDPSILSRNFQSANGGYEKLPHLELGNLIYMLKDGKQIFLDKANTSVYYPQNGTYSASHFKKWNNGVFSTAELARFSALDILVSDYPDKTLPCTVHFSAAEGEDDRNRAVLAKALEYIKDNYRNPAAHKDRMERSTVTTCRELMLSSEQMLWILLAIIDFSKPDIA